MLGSSSCRTLYIDYGKRCVVGLQVQSQYHEIGPFCDTKIISVNLIELELETDYM